MCLTKIKGAIYPDGVFSPETTAQIRKTLSMGERLKETCRKIRGGKNENE